MRDNFNQEFMLGFFKNAKKPLTSHEIQELCQGKIKVNSITATRSRLVGLGLLVELPNFQIGGKNVRRWTLAEKMESKSETQGEDRLSLIESKLATILKRLAT